MNNLQYSRQCLFQKELFCKCLKQVLILQHGSVTSALQPFGDYERPTAFPTYRPKNQQTDTKHCFMEVCLGVLTSGFKRFQQMLTVFRAHTIPRKTCESNLEKSLYHIFSRLNGISVIKKMEHKNQQFQNCPIICRVKNLLSSKQGFSAFQNLVEEYQKEITLPVIV